MKKYIKYLLISSFVFFVCTCKSQEKSIEKVPFDESLLELPANYTSPNEKLLSYCGFNLSYNLDKKVPNWVAYELTAEETRGKIKRRQEFETDANLDGRGADSRDYSHSGYSRGHLAPAADMRWDSCAMRNSFYMSNVCPQNLRLNDGCWNNLENRCRQWARVDNRGLYIICGPIFEKGEIKTIGRSKVAVPRAFFKAILQKRDDKYYGIAFVMLNSDLKNSLGYFAMSIDKLESLTGFDFFHNLPDNIEKSVEAVFSPEDWGLRKQNESILDSLNFEILKY